MNRLSGAWYNLETFMSLGRRHLGFDYQTDISNDTVIKQMRVSAETLAHLKDDLNTPAVLSHLFALAEIAKKGGDEGRDATRQILVDCLFLGVDPFRAIRSTRALRSSDETALIGILVGERNAARGAKNFKEADRIRDELAAKGIQLKDNPDGTTSWDVKR
jgi:cysteinyl-tRNA synthetase